MNRPASHPPEDAWDDRELEDALDALEPDPVAVLELAALLEAPDDLTERTAREVQIELLRRSTITTLTDLLAVGVRTMHLLLEPEEGPR